MNLHSLFGMMLFLASFYLVVFLSSKLLSYSMPTVSKTPMLLAIVAIYLGAMFSDAGTTVSDGVIIEKQMVKNEMPVVTYVADNQSTTTLIDRTTYKRLDAGMPVIIEKQQPLAAVLFGAPLGKTEFMPKEAK